MIIIDYYYTELLLFMASRTKDHILSAKLDIVSVPYFTVFGFLQ